MTTKQTQEQILDFNKFRQIRAIDLKASIYSDNLLRIDSILKEIDQQMRFDRLNKARSNDVVNSAVATSLAKKLDCLTGKIMDIQEALQIEECVAEVVDISSARKAREQKNSAE